VQVPSDVISHQNGTSNSELGWVVRWVLSTPRATPRPDGWAVPPCRVSCQYFPCSFVLLALRELGLRLGVRAPLPLRASSRGVLPGAGALVLVPVAVAVIGFRAVGSLGLEAPNRDSRLCTALSPAQGRSELLAAPNEVTRGDI
jgi:hypothetical protein